MSDVTVVGLGAMGSALVKALVDAGHTVTVWNRTRSKADALGGLGVERASSAADAIAASPITIVSVSTYEATRNILESTAEACSDRALVQLTTGTTAEAAKLAAWAQQHGASYVDGVIMAYPSDIGGPQTTLVVAGLEDTWNRCAQVLRALGGGTIWVGEDVRRPAVLDAAWFAPLIGMAIGVVHGALLCEKAGLPVESYAEMLPSVLEVAANQGPHLAQTIADNAFGQPDAALATYAAGATMMAEDAMANGINNEFPAFVAALLERAVNQGYGDQELSALIKLLR